MSLIVETGSASSTSESYCSVSAADARHQGLGNQDWATLTTASKEQSLRRATAFMEQAYRSRWAGCRVNATQALSWPRWNVIVDEFPIDSVSVPAAVVASCADLALKASTDTLNPDLERAVVREKIGPLETEYDRYAPQSTQFRAIDMALAPYLKGSSSMAMLVRS